MHLKLGFVIGCKITTFLQILQYAFYWMVTKNAPKLVKKRKILQNMKKNFDIWNYFCNFAAQNKN